MKTPSFGKKDGLSNGEFLKNTEVLKKHGILMKTPSFGKKDGLSNGEFLKNTEVLKKTEA